VDAVPVQSKVFPGEPFDPVSRYGLSHAFGDRYAKAGPIAGGRCKTGREKGSVHPPPLPEEANVFRPLPQPVRLGKRLSAQIWRPFSPHTGPTAGFQVPVGFDYPASRFLPLARRRLIIRRPCLVDIRFRNPWFRARRRRLG
jgi:hypothetical protein